MVDSVRRLFAWHGSKEQYSKELLRSHFLVRVWPGFLDSQMLQEMLTCSSSRLGPRYLSQGTQSLQNTYNEAIRFTGPCPEFFDAESPPISRGDQHSQ